ncbi:hypothetical protein BN8_01062 [Fibrisoma limi BUZ 3]|uniref:Uncharacterized protein n=1 Tax=Fibrisoma limi BUZ 3 TaxID=1185876 RepID=I2GDW5_9BACT|nr:hypothetical protein BN8_01062 [Fibrisoma limi BUZ 3]
MTDQKWRSDAPEINQQPSETEKATDELTIVGSEYSGIIISLKSV